MTDERTYRMEIQYDGSGLHGWAKQSDLLTVEGCLEKAFGTALGIVPSLRVGGRTDSGVHARRQVVSLCLPTGVDRHRLRASLNALTPPSITVSKVEEAPVGFDARKDAVSRVYRYHLFVGEALSPFWRPYSWWVMDRLDMRAVRGSAVLLGGRHDFTAFTPTETEHVFFHRTVMKCGWKSRRDDVVVFEIEADAFLRHMVRVLVGTMIEIGRGRRTQDDFARLLEGASREEAGPTAPAQGLFLWDIRY